MSPSGGYSTLKSFISTSFSSIIDRVQIGQKVSSNSSSELKELAEDLPPGTVRVSTPNKLFQITVRAMPLPHAIIKFLMDSEMDLKRMIEFDSGSNVKSTADDEEENSSSSQFRFLHTISDLAVKAKRDGALPCESPIWDSLSDR